jgi:putative oxidoreductase
VILEGPRVYHARMKSIPWRPVSMVVLRLILALGFGSAVLSKLGGQREFWAHQFVRWGYPGWGAVATSVVEIVGLVALWIPALAMTAVAVLTIVLVGAACTWLIHGPSVVAVFPGTLLVLVACLGWLEARARRASRYPQPN